MENWTRHSLQMESPHETTKGSLPPPTEVKGNLQDGQGASIFIKCMLNHQIHVVSNQSDFDWFRFSK